MDTQQVVVVVVTVRLLLPTTTPVNDYSYQRLLLPTTTPTNDYSPTTKTLEITYVACRIFKIFSLARVVLATTHYYSPTTKTLEITENARNSLRGMPRFQIFSLTRIFTVGLRRPTLRRPAHTPQAPVRLQVAQNRSLFKSEGAKKLT